jgi:hypothetical protein
MNPTAAASAEETKNYLDAMRDILVPLTRMLIAKGVAYPVLDDLLQRAYVEAAERWFVEDDGRATASRLYMLTGIHRKKIAPLRDAGPPPESALRRNLTAEVLEKLMGNPALLDRRGWPKPLAATRRVGGDESFDAVVEAVSKDIRPRALLDEWLRVGLARLDDSGYVHIAGGFIRSRFVPGEEVEALRQVLRPAVEAVVNRVLHTGARCGASGVHVGGLSAEAVTELSAEFQRRQRELLADINQKAERRALVEARRRVGGRHVFHAGGFDLCEGAAPAPAVPERAASTAPAARAGQAAAAAATRSNGLPATRQLTAQPTARANGKGRDALRGALRQPAQAGSRALRRMACQLEFVARIATAFCHALYRRPVTGGDGHLGIQRREPA